MPKLFQHFLKIVRYLHDVYTTCVQFMYIMHLNCFPPFSLPPPSLHSLPTRERLPYFLLSITKAVLNAAFYSNFYNPTVLFSHFILFQGCPEYPWPCELSFVSQEHLVKIGNKNSWEFYWSCNRSVRQFGEKVQILMKLRLVVHLRLEINMALVFILIIFS